MNYYEHFLGDYAKKTKRLRMLDHGAYRLMLDAYYAEEKPLPEEYEELCVICGAISKDDQQSVRKVADKFFPVGPDGLRHNERADEEIARAQKRIKASRENGKKNAPDNPPGNPAGGLPGTPADHPTGHPPDTRQVVHRVPQQHTCPGEAFLHAPDPIPSGGKGSEPRTPEAPRMPGNLTPPTWANWRSHLANRGKGMTPQQERLQLVRLGEHANPERTVQDAIAAGHQTLPPVGGWPSQQQRKTATQTRTEVAAEIWKDRPNERPDERVIDGDSERVA